MRVKPVRVGHSEKRGMILENLKYRAITFRTDIKAARDLGGLTADEAEAACCALAEMEAQFEIALKR